MHLFFSAVGAILRRILLPAALLFAPALRAEVAADERLAAFFEEAFQRELAASPELQTHIGIKGPDYGKWDDYSDAAARQRLARARANLARLHAEFDPAALGERQRLSYRIFEFAEQQRIDAFEWRYHDYGFSTMENPVSDALGFLQNMHAVDTREDAEAYIARLESFPRALDQMIENLREAARRGIVPTSFSFDPVLGDTLNAVAGAPFEDSSTDSALLADFRAKCAALDIPGAEREQLLARASSAMKGPLQAAIRRYAAAVGELRAQSPGPNGVWALPRGDEYYRNRIAFWTTDASLTPDALHELGLAEVARIRAEMEAIMRKVGFEGDLGAFFVHLRTDPGSFFPDTEAGREAYLAQSRAYIESIYADVGKYFNLLPKAPLEVRRVEAWREATAPIAFYNQPTPDGSRPGIYYVNLADMAAQQKYLMETVAYHEGAPGHHFQIAIQQELGDVPMFQKFVFFGAYIEGWALYAERLAKEQGRFTDPLQDFGRLQDEMLRAVRLVIDTGAHSRKWSRERMIEYFLANNPMTQEGVVKEVERYIDTPGQALSYKVGMLKILELRARAQEALGARFDIREFHDVVLGNGALPLPVLETQVDDYIARRASSA